MKIIEMIMVILGLFIWSCLGATFLITSIQSFIYDMKREKRDVEYHNRRMREFN